MIYIMLYGYEKGFIPKLPSFATDHPYRLSKYGKVPGAALIFQKS